MQKVYRLAAVLTAVITLSGCSVPVPIPDATPAPTARETSSPPTASSVPVPTPVPVPDLPKALQGRGRGIPLRVYIDETGVTETLPVEEYLCGVLAGEMRGDWPEEALKAQAILARTFLLYFMEEKGHSAFADADISTNVEESQAYDAAGINDAIRDAVSDTAGQVLVHDGAFINAWFCSCAGGRTAMATEGLGYEDGDPPYIRTVESPEEAAPEEFRTWSGEFTLQELREGAAKLGVTLGNVDGVYQAAVGPSGRTTLLGIGGEELPMPAFRVAMGPEKFRSTYLTLVEWDAGAQVLRVQGRGYGHGVGMSQWGAYTMAEKGKKAEEILAHYFAGTELVRAWDAS